MTICTVYCNEPRQAVDCDVFICAKETVHCPMKLSGHAISCLDSCRGTRCGQYKLISGTSLLYLTCRLENNHNDMVRLEKMTANCRAHSSFC